MKKILFISVLILLFSCQKETTQAHITQWRCIHAVNKATHKREYVGCCENGPTIDIYLAAKLKNYYTDPTEYNITTDSTACKNF